MKAKITRTKDYFSIETQIEINAPIKKVWAIMTNFDDYSWSSTLQYVRQEQKNLSFGWKFFGIVSKMTKPGEINQEEMWFKWSGHVSKKTNTIDNHKFILKKLTSKKTLLVQSDELKGKRNMYEKLTSYLVKRQYLRYNKELKIKVEATI